MNRVTLMGRLTRDPELRYTATSGKAVCNFTIAVDRKFVKQGEDKQADFLPVVVWSKLGEFCSNYFTKGRKVVVSGRVQTRSWDDAMGTKHYITEIVADEAYFADNRKNVSGVVLTEVNKDAELLNEIGEVPSEFYEDEAVGTLPF